MIGSIVSEISKGVTRIYAVVDIDFGCPLLRLIYSSANKNKVRRSYHHRSEKQLNKMNILFRPVNV